MADINLTHALIFVFAGILLALLLGFHKSPKASAELGASNMNKTSTAVRASDSVPIKPQDELVSYLQTNQY